MSIKISDKRYNFFLFIGLTVVLASLPFLFTHRIFFLTNRLAIVFIALLWISKANFIARLRVVKNEYLLISFVLMYCVEVVGLFYTSNYNSAFSSIERKLPLLLIPVIVITSDELKEKKLGLLLSSFAGSVTLASVICLTYAVHRNNYLEVFSNPNWFYFSYYDLTEILEIQPIYFSVFVSFSFFVVVFMTHTIWDGSLTARRLFYLLWAAYLFVFLFLLSGKTSIVATVAILMILAFVYFKRRGRLVGGLLTLLFILSASGVLLSRLPIVKERFLEVLGLNKTSIWVYGDPERTKPLPEARLIKWEAAFNVIRENWLVGVGSGDVQDELNKQYDQLNFQSGIEERFNTHNQFLQTWTGSGIIGLCILLLTFILGIVKSMKDKNHLYLVFIAVFGICCLTESTLERQYGILIYSLLSSLFYHHTKEESQFRQSL